MSAALKHPPARMTKAEFLAWDSGDISGARWHLVDGEPVAMAPASQDHGALQGEMVRLIGNHLLERQSRCRVIAEAGIVPQVRSSANYRVPDLAVTCAARGNTVDVPDPVLLVEVISPNNYAQTRANIWTYTTIPSVQEIVVVQSTRVEVELLRRQADGTWPKEPDILVDGASLHLASIDLEVSVLALYRTTSLTA